MSWHFSRALVEEFSEATCSDGAQSAQSSASPTPQAYLCSDRMTEFSRLSRFGMTFAPLTESLGADLLTWFLADSRVRTYQLPGMVPESMASDPVCGERWRESSVRYDLNSSSWKIHLSLFPEDLPWSSVNLPKWGMTRNGYVFQHPTLERPSIVTGCGWSGIKFPAPRASDHKGATSALAMQKAESRGYSPNLPEYIAALEGGGQMNPYWEEWLMGWPVGWTALKPLEMAKFREWQQQHSI